MKKILVYHCNKESELEKIIIAVEIKSIRNHLIILSEDLNWLKATFFSKFKIIKAGGGLVQNEHNKFLLMYRKKKWDLPKGKVEKGEKVREGAIREIEEETGVKILHVICKLGKTYHTYKLKDKWILKETVWYHAIGDGSSELIPQKEEDIEKVAWMSKSEAKKLIKENSYPSIIDVFNLNF